MGEDECFAAFAVEGVEQFVQGQSVVESGQAFRLPVFGDRLPVVDVGDARAGGGGSVAVDHHPAGDGQQPGAGAGAAGESRQAGEGTQERLLGQVVGAVRVAAQVGHESPDVSVGGADEAFDGVGIAASRGQRPASQLLIVQWGRLAAPRPGEGRNHCDMSLGP